MIVPFFVMLSITGAWPGFAGPSPPMVSPLPPPPPSPRPRLPEPAGLRPPAVLLVDRRPLLVVALVDRLQVGPQRGAGLGIQQLLGHAGLLREAEHVDRHADLATEGRRGRGTKNHHGSCSRRLKCWRAIRHRRG